MSNNRKVYSFKSVGRLQNDIDAQNEKVVIKNPVGILTPISFATTGGTLFNMSYSLEEQVKDNLKNLLLTNRGERLMMTDLGADLRPLAFEYSNENVVAAAISRISAAVAKYMPFVSLENFETRVENSLNGDSIGVVVRVTYSIPNISLQNQAVEAVIYAVG